MVGQDPVTFKGHSSDSFYVKSSFSPDDRYIVSGSCDADVYIWDVKHPLLAPLRLKGHYSEVSDVKWCPTDLSMLATCSDDTTVRVWKMNQCSRHFDAENDTDAFFGRGSSGTAEVHPSWNMPSSRSEDDTLECLIHLRETSWLSTLPGAHRAPRQLHGATPHDRDPSQSPQQLAEAELGLRLSLAVLADGGPTALLVSRFLEAVLTYRGPAAARASRLLAAVLAEAARLLVAALADEGPSALLASRLLAAVLAQASRLFAVVLSDGDPRPLPVSRLAPAVLAEGGPAAVLALRLLAAVLEAAPVSQLVRPRTRNTSSSQQGSSPQLKQATLDDLWQLRRSSSHHPAARNSRVEYSPCPPLKQTTLDDLWQLRRSSSHLPAARSGRVKGSPPDRVAVDGLPCTANIVDGRTSAFGPAKANNIENAAEGGKRKGSDDLADVGNGNDEAPMTGSGSRKRARQPNHQ